jgi:phage N-6-adenine-methyltransferase
MDGPPESRSRPGQGAAKRLGDIKRVSSSSTPATITQDVVASDLAERINALHGQALAAARTSIERAIECGRLLIQAKSEVGHGGWISWIRSNLSFGERQAQKYVRLAQNTDALPDTNSNSHLTIDGALKLLSAGDNSHFRTNFTGQTEWYTPPEYLDLARRVLGQIDLDPASCDIAQEQVGAQRYFTPEDDGLAQPWFGSLWVNPPYSRPAITLFVEKLVGEVRAGNVEQAILLTHNFTDTGWFHEAVCAADALCFTRGRIRFYGLEGELAAPPNGQTFFYFGDARDRFAEIFAEVGVILWPGRRP